MLQKRLVEEDESNASEIFYALIYVNIFELARLLTS